MSPLRIYLVEDSAVIRRNLIETLEENAPVSIVGVAEDEAGAIAMLRGGSPADVALIDIFLSHGSGIGVLRATEGETSGPQRVVFSNHATPDLRLKCEQLGATKVFDKSNEIDALLLWLNHLARSDLEATESPT